MEGWEALGFSSQKFANYDVMVASTAANQRTTSWESLGMRLCKACCS